MEKLVSVIENYVELDGDITADMNFKKDLGLSSFDTVCMIDEIKDTIGVALNPTDFVKYKTVGEMAEYISTIS